jgi:hypothetical protein
MNAKTFVYCILSPLKQAAKIGISKNPRRRLAQLQTGSVDPLVLAGAIHAEGALEKGFHFVFRDKWLGGEWFDNRDGMIAGTFADLAVKRRAPGHDPVQGA